MTVCVCPLCGTWVRYERIAWWGEVPNSSGPVDAISLQGHGACPVRVVRLTDELPHIAA